MLNPENSESNADSESLQERTHVFGPTDSASALVRVLDDYLADLQAGKQPDREQLLADHPELAPQLEQCLSGLEFIQSASLSSETAPTTLGDFRVMREVGRGGMGVVYEAEQISLRRKVALKVLRFATVADSEAMQRFQREAETVAGLHHTNIVPIFAIGADDGVHYYAMQFIEGRSLAELSGPDEQISTGDIADWGLQAADALAHAHQRGVVHRDVKPSNLILDDDGRIWLTDFGLAKRTDDVTLSVAGALLGTPRYMSPEQASALTKPVDHRTDIYSLGATLYELATGQPIFNAESPYRIITQILNEEPLRPRAIKPDLPRDLETIILKCLSKDPSQRYQSARDLADDLRAFVEERPIKARRVSLLQRAARWIHKHRRGVSVAAISAAATILLTAGGLFAWRQYQWSQMGHVVFQTEQAQVEAEVFDRNGQVVLPAFSLPTKQPISLPEGAYLARVSAPGILSQTYQLELTARGNHTDKFDVHLPDGELFKPIDVSASAVLRMIEINGNRDLIRIDVEDNKRQMWRIDGATGQEAWRISLQSHDNLDLVNLPHDLENWSRVFNYGINSSPGVCSEMPDLDGDGTGDLVWASVATTSLLAVSGESGDLLWWFQSSVDPDRKEGDRFSLWGRVVGLPAVAEVDGDGVPDLVAMFARSEHKWIEAVSGKDGSSLWRQALDSQWFRSPGWSSEEQLFAPELIEIKGKPVIALAACTRFLLMQVDSGEMLWTEELETVVVQQPRFGQLDDDGDTDAVLLLDTAQLLPELVAFSLTDRRRLWEQQLSARYEPYAESPGRVEWPLVVDLDHDGTHEVVIPSYREHELTPGQPIKSSELEVLNGQDGSSLWRRELRRERESSLLDKPDRFVVGPDLNADGYDELFAASVSHRFGGINSKGTILYLDALSGKNGNSLWWWSRVLENWNDKVGELNWCTPGPGGWPMLLVPVIGWSGNAEQTHVLTGGSGDELCRIAGAFRAHGADLDDDGLDELCYWTGGEFDMRRGTGEFHAVHNPALTRWVRLLDTENGFLPAEDLDGDGVDDVVVMGDSLQAVSGATGWTLWRQSGLSAHVCVPLTGPVGDLDGDGTGDLLVVDQYGIYSSMPLLPLRALSGKTGQLLWTAQIETHMFDDTYLLDLRDLDGDGAAEVVFAGGWNADTASSPSTAQKSQMWLTVLAGSNGRVKWKHALSQLLDRGLEWQFDLCTGDLNGDGTLDLVVPAIAEHDDAGQARWLLQAVNGIDGETLWEFPLAERGIYELDHLNRQAPWPVIGDLNGDGSVEVIVTDNTIAKVEDTTRPRLESSVIAIDGETGEQRWAWTWNASGSTQEQRPAVIMADVHRDRELFVGLRTSYGKDAETVIFDANGSVVERSEGGERFDELAGPIVAEKWRSRNSGYLDDQQLTLNNNNGSPYRVSRGPGPSDSLICENELPAESTGREPYTAPQKRDPRLARPLPWNFPVRNRGPWPLSFLGDAAIAMLATGVITLIVLIVPALLIRWALRWHSRTLWGLVAVYFVGLIAFGVFARGGAPVTPWYSMLLPALGGSLVGLPDVTFVALLGASFFRGQWKKLGNLCVGVLSLGLFAAAVLFWYDHPYRIPGDYYTTSGWWWAFVAGAYLTGVAAFLFLAGRFAIDRMKRYRSKNTTAVASA